MEIRNLFVKKSVLLLALTISTGWYIGQVIAEQIPVTTLEKALNLTEVDETTGCVLLSSAGQLLAPLNQTERARACVTCGENWSKDEKNNGKALTVTCGKLGSPTDKQKEILTKALSNCEQLALLYRRFDLLSKEQRIQALSTCFGKWEQHPKARKAAMKHEDIDESQQVKGEMPTWQDVSQMQIFAKSDAQAQLTQEINKEQLMAVLAKK